MKKISVYTRDGEIGSSSYYRILQYFKKIDSPYIKKRVFLPCFMTKAVYNSKHNIAGIITKLIYHLWVYIASIIFLLCDNLKVPECVVVLRSIEPKTFIFPVNMFYKRMLKKTKKCIWDFDDDIFCNNEISEGEADILKECSDKIVVTHEYLARLLPKNIQEKIVLMPTTDGDFSDLCIDDTIECRKKAYYNEFRIVWLASSAGLNDLKKVAFYLDEAAKKYKNITGNDLTLVIICNRMPDYEFKFLKIEKVEWSRQGAVNQLKKAHLGIMPLINNKFSLGKGGFKIVQYMAAGLPAIASAVGFNNNVIDDEITGYLVNDDNDCSLWVEKIISIALNEKYWERMSLNSYKKWQSSFCFDNNLSVWCELIGVKQESEDT